MQYRAIRYAERLEPEEVVASVASKGDSYDSAMAEALNSLFKAELDPNKGPLRVSTTSRSPSPSGSIGSPSGVSMASAATFHQSNMNA